MSRFLAGKYRTLSPYVPGEQPREREYIKLNTNESPFPPSPRAVEYAAAAAKTLAVYPDPDYKALCDAFANETGLRRGQLIPANGSDEILDMAFAAFGESGAVFPDMTYGFYRVFARKHGIEYREIPVKSDFSIDPADYFNAGGAVFIANPNAPTGLALTLDQIESVVKNNGGSVVVVDEAYIDFGGESAVSLIDKYENLLVTRTFSKSRAMAGARLGFGAGSEPLIADLQRIRFSSNPYNVNAMTAACGIGSLADKEYFESCLAEIIKARGEFERNIETIGFSHTASSANFVFAKHKKLSGEEVYKKLRENGVLARYFPGERTKDHIRITVADRATMNVVFGIMKKITEEEE